jgi:hypothetical protein
VSAGFLAGIRPSFREKRGRLVSCVSNGCPIEWPKTYPLEAPLKITFLIMLGLMPIVFVPASYGTQQDTLQIYRGLVTNAAFGQLQPTSRQAYLEGVVDGMMLAPLFDAPRTRMARFEKCLPRMTCKQIDDIVTKYLADNARTLRDPIHLSAFNAVSRACT